MADNATTPPAAAGVTPDQVKQLVNDAVSTALAPIVEANKQLSTQLEALVAANTKPAKTEQEQPTALTIEQVDALLTKRLESTRASDQVRQQRDSFIADKLKDLPPRYRNGLGNDPAKWAAEEQAIRAEYIADQKAAGVTPKSLGNAANDGGVTPDRKPIDRSKMSSMDLLNSDN